MSRYRLVLQQDFHVNDALNGADTKGEVLSFRKELTDLPQSAGLNIRECASNDQGILQGLFEQDKSRRLQLGESQTLKTLGIFWDSQDDAILYSVEFNAHTFRVTKRSAICDRQNLRSTGLAHASDRSSEDYTSTSLVVEDRLG